MLEDLNALLEEAKKLPELPADGEYKTIPDGEYTAVIENVQFKESKSGKLMFVWEFIISEGDYAKYHEWKYSMLTSAEGMQRLLTDLKKFGVDTSKDMAGLESQIDLLLDVPVILTITTSPSKDPNKDPFRNISVKPCNS